MEDSRGGYGSLCGCNWCILCGFLGSRLFGGVGDWVVLLLGNGLRGFLVCLLSGSGCRWFVLVGLLWCWVFLVFVLFGLCVLWVARGIGWCFLVLVGLLVWFCIVVVMGETVRKLQITVFDEKIN